MRTADYAALVALDWGDRELAFALRVGEETETGLITAFRARGGGLRELHERLGPLSIKSRQSHSLTYLTTAGCKRLLSTDVASSSSP